MAEYYIGEIRMFSGSYAPVNWQLCNGQLLLISEYEALYSLLGVTYGGDGRTNFALPDLRGRVPIHRSSTYALGQSGGTEKVSLVSDQLPAHTHGANAQSAAGNSNVPTNNFWSQSPFASYSTATTGLTAMNASAISAVGGNQPHDNMMPFNTISFIIATTGIYPTPSS